jgi:hypothetical protein
MHKSYLTVGRICYWQIRGWHGCHVVIKISIRFVYYKAYNPDDRSIGKELYRSSIKSFLAGHCEFSHCCEYSNSDIGTIINVNKEKESTKIKTSNKT